MPTTTDRVTKTPGICGGDACIRGHRIPVWGLVRLSEDVRERATNLHKRGFKPADALHVAAAEKLEADVLLSCDDRLCRLARHHRRLLNVEVVNPLDWLKEIGDDLDS